MKFYLNGFSFTGADGVLVKNFPISIDLTHNQFSELSETNYPPFLAMTSNPENISNPNITDHHIG